MSAQAKLDMILNFDRQRGYPTGSEWNDLIAKLKAPPPGPQDEKEFVEPLLAATKILGLKQVSARTGLSESSVSRTVTVKTSPKLRTLFLIAHALGFEVRLVEKA